MRDHYEVLGLNGKTTEEEIKKAYRKLAKQLHPDKNQATDAEDKFKELSAAYEVLKGWSCNYILILTINFICIVVQVVRRSYFFCFLLFLPSSSFH